MKFSNNPPAIAPTNAKRAVRTTSTSYLSTTGANAKRRPRSKIDP
jgi:hypothetical protein